VLIQHFYVKEQISVAPLLVQILDALQQHWCA